jgi:hypothetical protein
MTQITLVHRDTLSCEAIVRPTPDGGLLIASTCGGFTEPDPDNRVFVFKSIDGGATWSRPSLIIPETGHVDYPIVHKKGHPLTKALISPDNNGRSVIQTEVTAWPDGRIWVWMIDHDGLLCSTKSYIMESVDSGETWNMISDMPFFDDNLLLMRGALRLPDGVTLLPYHRCNTSSCEKTRDIAGKGIPIFNSELAEAEVGCFITRDDGKTFELGTPFYIENTWDGERVWQWPEPTLAQLSDGTIAMLIRRNHAGILFRADSHDGGRTFTNFRPTDIPNPSNKPKLLNLRDGRIALLNTPNNTTGLVNRHPLEIWVSDDDMKTWEYKRKLITLPGAISCPDGYEGDDGEILLAIEFNRHDIYFIRHRIEE